MTDFANLTCVVPRWQVSSRVTALSTTRLGGVSQPPFDTLNLGLHVGDKVDDVMENRRRLVQSFALPNEPVWLSQSHSTTICSLVADSEFDAAADGSYTTTPDIVLCVLTADCLPVVISDVEGQQIAVVHAGWRGLAGGILNNALSAFKSGSQLHAWLGPAIGPSHFEVGDDVRDVFVKRHDEHAQAFTAGNTKGKYWADIYALATSALKRSGCQHVVGGDYCTHAQSDSFHSHRRDGVSSGRMATLAWISSVGS